jgi:hypothetical protein
MLSLDGATDEVIHQETISKIFEAILLYLATFSNSYKKLAAEASPKESQSVHRWYVKCSQFRLTSRRIGIKSALSNDEMTTVLPNTIKAYYLLPCEQRVQGNRPQHRTDTNYESPQSLPCTWLHLGRVKNSLVTGKSVWKESFPSQ